MCRIAASSDYIAPKSTGLHDWIGGFAVTTGLGCHERVAQFKKDNDDYNAILLESLADRLAEAFRRAPAPAGAQGVLGLCAR